MSRLRRVLAQTATIWLCCQIGTVALVPVEVWVSSEVLHAEECTCGLSATMCPMHHKAPKNSAHCAMQAADSSDALALTAPLAATILSEPVLTIRPPDRSSRPVPTDVDVFGERPVPPDPPPPRG